jgi:hypothetical protein
MAEAALARCPDKTLADALWHDDNIVRCRWAEIEALAAALLDRGDDQALVGIDGAASGASRVTPTTDIGLVHLKEVAQRSRTGLFAQPVALVCHGPRRLVGHLQFPLQEPGETPRLARPIR